MSLQRMDGDLREQRTRRPAAGMFHLGTLCVIAAMVAVACRDVKPTESVRGIGARPKPVCYSNGISCICFPGTVGTWPNCVAEEAPPLVSW